MVERSVLLKGLEHPFLVGLHFSFQTPNRLYLVLDYVNGGEVNVTKMYVYPISIQVLRAKTTFNPVHQGFQMDFLQRFGEFYSEITNMITRTAIQTFCYSFPI